MNTARRRNTIFLYVDILRTIGSGARKSSIVYKANLNFVRCGRYLEELLRMGLIEVETGSPPTWVITEKGVGFLKKYEGFKEFLSP